MPASAPERGDVRGVDLGAAGLGIVEIAPREDRDAAQPGAGGDVAELGDDVAVVRTQIPRIHALVGTVRFDHRDVAALFPGVTGRLRVKRP